MSNSQKYEKLAGKNILIISNGGYQKELKNLVESLGMNFYHLSDKPSDTAYNKIAGRLHLWHYEKILDKYYKDSINNIQEDMDYIIVIRGEYTTINAIRLLKEKNPKAKVVLYMWDSIHNNKGINKKWFYFNEVYTFDRKDYMNNKEKIKFLPLFYCEELINEVSNVVEDNYDVAFIGTGHGDRVKIIKKVVEECEKNGLKVYSFIYSPHILVYIYNKLFNKNYKKVKISDLQFKPLSKKKIYEIYKSSKCILDIEISTQTGLTMRTMDILGLKKKLITTNKDIENYDFYNDNNISIVDRNDFKIDYDFLKKQYHELLPEIYDKYTMTNWLLTLLN